MFEHLIPSHNINLYAVHGHLSFQGRFSGCALWTTEIVIPQKAWIFRWWKIHVSPFAIWGQTETSSPCIGHCSSLVKLQLSLMISLILMTPRTIYRGSFLDPSSWPRLVEVSSVVTEISGWTNEAKTAQEHQWFELENAWINSDLMSFSSCVFTLLNGYFEAFWVESSHFIYNNYVPISPIPSPNPSHLQSHLCSAKIPHIEFIHFEVLCTWTFQSTKGEFQSRSQWHLAFPIDEVLQGALQHSQLLQLGVRMMAGHLGVNAAHGSMGSILKKNWSHKIDGSSYR